MADFDAWVVTDPATQPVGPLTQRVLDYDATMRGLVPTATTPQDWSPLEEYVAVDAFHRVGTFLERQDWPAYLEMVTGWATAIDRFETTVHRISEIDDLVYYQIEERHHRGEHTTTVNSLTIFRFDSDQRIHRLDVFLQQEPR